MPQMDNPRLAAATDVVSSDAEEQILDPRTLAMLKYKDALQAMQAADQMMAAAQPAPTAPTVAERTKLAAEQGIAGLAQRLAPGVQQQGRQVAAQQAQQAQGGLPQLSAPNMAGMAGGGIVAFSGEDGSVVEKPPKATSLRREKELVDAGVPPDEARRIAREEMYQGMGELAVPTLLTALDTPRRVITEVVPGAVADAYRGAAGVFRRNIEDPARAMLEGATRGGGEPTTAEEIAALYPDSTTATPAAQETSPSTGTVNLSRLDKSFPKREAPGAPAAQPMDGIAGILQAMQTQAKAPITAGAASESTNERQAQVDALNEQRMNPNYAETTRTAEEARYRAATDPSMKELKALIRSRSDALDKPMFTPEEERSRKISALLQGLASSNLIAQSGPAASRGIAAVSDAVREDSRARAEKQFDLASSLIGADMKASQDAFAAGLSATTQAMADQSVALNAVSSQLIAEGNREAAALIAQSQNQMRVFEAQLKDAADLRKILSDESIADTQAGAAARRDLINLQGNLYSGVDAIDRTIAEMNDSLGAATPASQAAVTTLNNQKAAMIRGADAISQEFGISVDSAADGTSSPVNAEMQSLLDQYSTP
jgi:hypothetical protein